VASSFPRSADELGVDWLNAILLRAGLLRSPSITSIDVKVIGVGEGFLGQLARVVPHCSGEEPDLPGALIAKFASTNGATRELARGQNYYGREIGFYRDIGAEAGIPIPRCYHAELDEESYTFVLLLEDLHPARPSDQVAGTDPEGSRRVVESFAELHARWWNSERLAGYDWAKPFIDEQPMEDGLERMKASIERIQAKGTFDRYPEMRALLRYLPPLFRVKPPPPWPYTLVHGDLRSDNVFFPSAEGGRFAMIDWQVSGMDFAARDIARWLVQSIGVEQRRATEAELLAHYHAELIRHDRPNPSFPVFAHPSLDLPAMTRPPDPSAGPLCRICPQQPSADRYPRRPQDQSDSRSYSQQYHPVP